MKDVGKSKAEVAAERIMQRVQGVTVTPHHCRIEEKPMEFYEQFHILVLGLDSLEARRYMNQVACSFLGESFQLPGRRSLANNHTYAPISSTMSTKNEPQRYIVRDASCMGTVLAARGVKL